MRKIKVRSKPGHSADYRTEAFLEMIQNNHALAGDFQPVVLRKSDTLFNQGDPSDAIFILRKGHLCAAIVQQDGSEIVVGQIRPGELVGEMQILSGGSRTAHVYALRRSELVKVPKLAFERNVIGSRKLLRNLAVVSRRRARRNQLVAILCKFFGRLDEIELEDIESDAEWIRLQRGEVLFRQGDIAASLYVLISGRLAAVQEEQTDGQEIIGEIGPGELVGEMAILTGEPRSTSIYALRNSLLVQFTKEKIDQIISKYPQVLKYTTQTVISRLHKTIRPPSLSTSEERIALIAARPDVPLPLFAEQFCDVIAAHSSILHLSSKRLDDLIGIPGLAQTTETEPYHYRLATGLALQAAKHHFIIYEADINLTPWTKRCLQDADQIIIVANASSQPQLCEIENKLLQHGAEVTAANQTLVLLHPRTGRLPCGSSEWLAKRKIKNHFHVRWNERVDINRLARTLTKRALGLALSGGGARGFAHIGAIRALEEANLSIDIIGGTSNGATIAALYAMGNDCDRIANICKHCFVEMKPLKDYTFPIISLLRGKKFDNLCKDVFGDTQIEDLWLRFFCISSNLSTADVMIHETGPLWKAVRASNSFPGVMPPVVYDHNLIIDGGVLDNLPAKIMRQRASGKVIAFDVSPAIEVSVDFEELPSPWEILWRRIHPFKKALRVPTIFDVLMRTTTLSSANALSSAKVEADFYLHLPVDKYGLLEYKAIDEIVEIGYQYTKEKITEWKTKN